MSISMNGISGTDYSAVINKTQTSGLENTLGSVNKGQATDDEMMERDALWSIIQMEEEQNLKNSYYFGY